MPATTNCAMQAELTPAGPAVLPPARNTNQPTNHHQQPATVQQGHRQQHIQTGGPGRRIQFAGLVAGVVADRRDAGDQRHAQRAGAPGDGFLAGAIAARRCLIERGTANGGEQAVAGRAGLA